jgi:hypothetical protein
MSMVTGIDPRVPTRRNWLAVVAGAAALGLSGGRASAEEALPEMAITVAEGDWDAGREDILAVCRSAAGEIARHVPGRKWDPILIRQDQKQGPMVIYGRGPDGSRRVLLNVRGTFWSQLAYQFAHELCHILCNYREANRANLWFEETLCETASLFALRRMAESWRTRPPYSNWKGYAASLGSYAQERLDATARLDGLPLAQWYRRHEAELRKVPTDRAKNQVVAAALLPLLEKEPAAWAALGSLNQWDARQELTFAEYLRDWHTRVPEDRQGFVAAVGKLFQIDV